MLGLPTYLIGHFMKYSVRPDSKLNIRLKVLKYTSGEYFVFMVEIIDSILNLIEKNNF